MDESAEVLLDVAHFIADVLAVDAGEELLPCKVADPVLAKFGSKALYLERWEIFILLLN